MEFLIEILLELIFEGSISIISDKKIPKAIRYPLITLIMLFFVVVVGGLIFIGIIIFQQNILAGILIMAVGLMMLILGIVKFKKLYKK